MPDEPKFILEHDVAREYREPLRDLAVFWKFKTWVDLLVVVDTEIGVDPATSFGISSVIDLIRNASVGCMRWRVDIALRNGESPTVVSSPGAYDPKYRGFRFHMQDGGTPVIDKYEQIWCFGFKPSNSGNTSDAEIDQSFALPASDAELAKLAQWMDDRKGGLFGTGDHHFLGASMCRRIPRLGTMRRWTNADGVPPIGTPDRIDTLRPPSPAYEPTAPGGPLALANSPHQGDDTPQPIRWVAWWRTYWPFLWRKRPHPVLCHPTLGPIDRMPDHAHEGLCVPTAEIDGSTAYDFGTGSHPEYPNATGGGPKPMPEIIAYGSTLGHPPYNFAKGPQPARSQFPMISVYDGHLAGVGRVATDSTWHHWMNINIDTLKGINNDDWKKISRYFINLAVWLNPPGYSTKCFWFSAIASHFQYPGFQEYRRDLSRLELGAALHQHLIWIYGPCWVTERIWFDIVEYKRLWPWEILHEHEKVPTRLIDTDLIEKMYLGSLVEATFDEAIRVKKAVTRGPGKNRKIDFDLPRPDELFDKPIRSAISESVQDLRREAEATLEVLRSLGSPTKTPPGSKKGGAAKRSQKKGRSKGKK